MHTLTSLEDGSMRVKSLRVSCLYCKKVQRILNNKNQRRGTPLCDLYSDMPPDTVRFLASLSRTGCSGHIILYICPKQGMVALLLSLNMVYTSDNFQDQKTIAWLTVSINSAYFFALNSRVLFCIPGYVLRFSLF